MLSSGILFVIKFPWLHRTFKTADLDDPQESLREIFTYLQGRNLSLLIILQTSLNRDHEAVYRSKLFYHHKLEYFAVIQKSLSRGENVAEQCNGILHNI